MWTMRRSTVRMWLKWNWCFKLLMVLSRTHPSPFRFILFHSKSVQIYFAVLVMGSPFAWRMLCISLSKITGNWSNNYAIKEDFYQDAVFQYDARIRLPSSLYGRFAHVLGNQSGASLYLKANKNGNREEETAKGPAVTEKDARQESNCSLWRLNSQGKAIVVGYSGGQ